MDSTGTMAFPEAAKNAQARACDSVIFEVPSEASMISGIRRRVRKIAHSMHFTPDQLDDICIAVGEAATNAIKHGCNPDHPCVGVKVESGADILRVFISDKGRGFDPATVCPPGIDDLRECGRGLLCMRSVMDEVVFHHLDPGTCVEMTKRVTPP